MRCILCQAKSPRKLHSDGFFYHGGTRCTGFRHRPSKADIAEAKLHGHNQQVGSGAIVEVWDQSWFPSVDCEGIRFRGRYVIGVNWSAVGPVTPAQAREFARNVLKAADIAEKRIAKCKAEGWERGNLK